MAQEDPFARLGFAQLFDIDPAQVQRAYLKRCADLHPDRMRDPLLQAEAARESARLNEARAVLLDDEKRANALLALMGGPGPSEDKSLPDGFLMRMMEVRQELEAAAQADHERLAAWAEAERAGHIERVRALFAAPDAAGGLEAIRVELNAWRYIERMIEQIDPAV
jgi:DnaJ-domain-containing protein 1